MLKVIDLFSGCGGLSLGFEMAGYDVLLAVDNFKPALETYSKNRKSTNVLEKNIDYLDIRDILRIIKDNVVDLVIGGPPCQGFSLSGFRKIDDPRNKHYISFFENQIGSSLEL